MRSASRTAAFPFQGSTLPNAVNVSGHRTLRLTRDNYAIKATVGSGPFTILVYPRLDLTARGGSIVVGNVLSWTSGAGKTINTALPPAVNQSAGISVAGGVTLDASGLWTNLLNDADNIQGPASTAPSTHASAPSSNART